MRFKMKPIALAILASAALLFLFSCKDKHDNDDVTNGVNKSGAIESAIKVDHLDSLRDVLITTHTVWAHGQATKTIYYRDTIPALGIENTTAENQDGETKKVSVKKDYEIFITIK